MAQPPEWDALVKFHADPFVRHLISWLGNTDFRLIHCQIRWKDTGNPYYVWRAIAQCIHSSRELDSWIVEYLGQCANRMLSEDAKHEKDFRKILPWVFDFASMPGSVPAPGKNRGRKRGPGEYRPRPDGDEDAWIWLAVAEYFAAEIEKGATPVEARNRALEKCLEYRYDGKPIGIDEANHQWLVKSLAADVDRKLSDVDDKTLRIKAMNFAQRNVLSAFEFAQKIVQAKDIQELIQTQNEFVQSQMQVLSEQVKDLGEAATKAAMDSFKDLGETASKTTMSVKDLGEAATKTAMKNVKDLSEAATKAATEGMKDLGETAKAA